MDEPVHGLYIKVCLITSHGLKPKALWVAQNWRTLTSFDNQQPALTNDVDISFEVGRIKNIALSQWGKWKT